MEALRTRTVALRPAIGEGGRSSRGACAAAQAEEAELPGVFAVAGIREAELRGACAAAWAAGPSLGGGARRGRPHGKGEVRWPLLPPAPRSVARRKMADLEEQLSDEEKVGAAAAKSRAGGRDRVPRREGWSLTPGWLRWWAARLRFPSRVLPGFPEAGPLHSL